jgi:pimeloyl-ACP methyl ester carboxylesterase
LLAQNPPGRAKGATKAGIAGSKRVVIAETGHLMYLEKPEEFSREVITFIASNGY